MPADAGAGDGVGDASLQDALRCGEPAQVRDRGRSAHVQGMVVPYRRGEAPVVRDRAREGRLRQRDDDLDELLAGAGGGVRRRGGAPVGEQRGQCKEADRKGGEEAAQSTHGTRETAGTGAVARLHCPSARMWRNW